MFSPPSPLSLPLRRDLCEIVYRPTDQRRDEVLAHDWGELPRISEALQALPEPVSPAAVADLAWNIVLAAVTELESSFPARADAITPLEVVQLHILDRQPWPSIEAMLREEGRAHSRGTLIRRQHEFMPYLESWAAQGTRSRRRPGVTAAILVVLLLGVAFFMWPDPSGDPRYMDVREYRDFTYRLFSAEDWKELQGSMGFEPHPLPAIGFEPRGIMLLPPGARRGPLAFAAARKDSPDPGQIALWDSVTGELLWVSRFKPSRDEALTHATLPDVAADDPFIAGVPLHDAELIPDRIAVNYTNRFSACFLVQFDLATGAVLSNYAPPGRLESGLILDLDGDGRGEYVWAGQENVVNQAVVLALAPSDEDGQASTVVWRSPPGKEDAIVRTLLPPARDLESALGATRLQVRPIYNEDWNSSQRTLVIDVLALANHQVYTAFLDSSLCLADLMLGESAENVWRDADVEKPRTEQLLGSVLTLRSSDAELPPGENTAPTPE